MKIKTRTLFLTAAMAAVLALSLTGCGGSGGEETASSEAAVVSTVSQADPTPTEPASLPFTMPEGFTYNKDYSTAETALYSNSSGIAITFARTDSSPSYLLAAQNNTATKETTQSAVEAGRTDISDLDVEDFDCKNGEGYIAYRYTLTFTSRSVDQVNYVYTYTTESDNYAVSVNAAQSKTDDAKKVADGIVDSFDA